MKPKRSKVAVTNAAPPPRLAPPPEFLVEVFRDHGTFSEALSEWARHYAGKSQTHVSFMWGYARVEISEGAARGQREEAAPDAPWEEFAGQSRVELVAWAAGILSTGRTVRCGAGVNLSARRTMPRAETSDVPMEYVRRMVEAQPSEASEALTMDVDYQRGRVWTEAQQRSFLGFWLEGGAVPSIYVQRYQSAANCEPGANWMLQPSEVLDGKQRLSAMMAWLAGEIPAVCVDGSEIWYRDTNEVDRRQLPLVRLTFVDLPLVERLTFYLKLTRGGTPHTDEEIARVRAKLEAEIARRKGSACA